MYDFFCHGLSSSSNSSYRRRQKISRWYGSKRRRRNSTSTHTTTTSSRTNNNNSNNNNKLHGTRSDEVPNQLQEETQTEKEAKEKKVAEQYQHHHLPCYQQEQEEQPEKHHNPPHTLEKQLQTSLEEVPFEIIEAEDILLWGCPPIKIPRMVFNQQQQRQLLEQTSVFYTNNNNNSYSKNPYKSSFNHHPSSFSLEKAASIPVYRKCRKFLTETSSDSFDFDQWDDFFNDLISRPSRQATTTAKATNMKNITISWCDFNPFENLHFNFLNPHPHSSNKSHSHSDSNDNDSEEEISRRNDLLLNNFTTNFYHNIFATEDQVINHHVQPKCYNHQKIPYESTCEVFDVPSGDDKAVVIIQSTNKQRAFETSSIFESPIIHEYSSEGEGESLRQHNIQARQKEKSINSTSTSNSSNNENIKGDKNNNNNLLNITITEINSHPSFSSCSPLSQVRKLLQGQNSSSDSSNYDEEGQHQHSHSLLSSPTTIETQILFQSQHHSNSTNRTESIPSESNNKDNNNNNNTDATTENKIDNNIDKYIEERAKQLEISQNFGDFEQFFDDVRMLNSLPTVFTVYNIENDTDCSLCRENSGNCGRHRHRRRAASVAITQQNEFNDSNQPVELTKKESGNNNNNENNDNYTNKTKSKSKPTDDSEIFEVFRMKPHDSSSSKLRLANSSKCDGSIMIMNQQQQSEKPHHQQSSEFSQRKCRRRRSSSAPNSQTVSLMSFSPNESFTSSLELNPIVLNIFEENFPLSKDDEKSPLDEKSSNNNNWNYYYHPGITESMDGENFGNFGKFYPPPTPLSKKSSSKSSKNNNNITSDTESVILINEQIAHDEDQNKTSNNSKTQEQTLEATSNNNNSISSKKSILKKSNYDYHHGTTLQKDEELNSNKCKIIKTTTEIPSTTSHKNTTQKSILKNSFNNNNHPLAKSYESKCSSVKIKGEKEASQKSILKSRKSSTVKTEEEDEEKVTEDQASANPLSSQTTTTVHNTDSSSFTSSTLKNNSNNNNNNSSTVNSITKNTHHLKIKKPIRNKLVLQQSFEKLRTKSRNSVNKCNKLVSNDSSEKLSVSTTNNNNNNNNNEMIETVKSDDVQEQSNTQSKKKSRFRQKLIRPTFPPRYDEDQKNDNKRPIDRQHNIKFRRKSIIKPSSSISSSGEYPMTRLRKCPEEADISEKYFRNDSKPHPVSSETTWGSTSLSNSYSSDEGSNSRGTRKKGRKKLTLWQKMRRIFFGCPRKSKETSYNSGHSTSINVNQNERSTSLFERIICWWRKASHRKVIVRQDSLQLIRIKRQKWLREIHEFYEDVHAVYKNPRVTERSRSKKKSTTKFENIPVKIVNSEGCILLREQTALLDAHNGNRPKEKPLKGILKNTNNKSYKSKSSKTKPSRHINYKYS